MTAHTTNLPAPRSPKHRRALQPCGPPAVTAYGARTWLTLHQRPCAPCRGDQKRPLRHHVSFLRAPPDEGAHTHKHRSIHPHKLVPDAPANMSSPTDDRPSMAKLKKPSNKSSRSKIYSGHQMCQYSGGRNVNFGRLWGQVRHNWTVHPQPVDAVETPRAKWEKAAPRLNSAASERQGCATSFRNDCCVCIANLHACVRANSVMRQREGGRSCQ